jgi:hypothetical protein
MTDLKIIATDRGQGKTTLATTWLMAGRKIDTYPGWSRILVCANSKAVVPTADRMPHGPWRKCVFSLSDLRSAMRGAIQPGTVEVAVDDAELLMSQALGVGLWPSLITITGRAVQPIPSELQ